MPISSFIGYTNIVLLVTSQGGIRKFAAYEDNKEVLQKLEVVKSNTDISAKMFEHPIENGALITDHRILNPKTVSLQAYIAIDDTETLKELNYYYISGTALKIRTGNDVITNAYIVNQPFEITGACIDKTLYSIQFREGQEVTPVYTGLSNARRRSNTSRVNLGQKQGKKVNRSFLFSAIHGGRTS